MIHFPICEVVLKIDWQSSHKVTQYYINNEYWRELVHKLRKFELVIALKVFEIFKIYSSFFVGFLEII